MPTQSNNESGQTLIAIKADNLTVMGYLDTVACLAAIGTSQLRTRFANLKAYSSPGDSLVWWTNSASDNANYINNNIGKIAVQKFTGTGNKEIFFVYAHERYFLYSELSATVQGYFDSEINGFKKLR